MCTIYENIKELCDLKKIKPGKMCVDIGISKSILTGLKNGTKKNIQTDTAQKIADYFGVSVDCVLGSAENKKSTTPEGMVLTDTQKAAIDFVMQLSEDQLQKFVKLADLFLEESSSK